jgi:hypothetical protein
MRRRVYEITPIPGLHIGAFVDVSPARRDSSAKIESPMRIEYRDQQRRKIGQVVADAAARPTRAPITEPGFHQPQREAFLNWEGAIDDAGQLRKCIACGCPDLFREKAFPQITGLVVVMAFAGAIAGVVGLANNLPALLGMTALLALDVAILAFSQRRLVCYRCRSSYHDLPLARYHRPWDRAVAERHPPGAAPAPLAPLSARAAPAPQADAAAQIESQPAAPPTLRKPERDRRRIEDDRTAPAPPSFADSADLPLEKKSYFA